MARGEEEERGVAHVDAHVDDDDDDATAFPDDADGVWVGDDFAALLLIRLGVVGLLPNPSLLLTLRAT